MAADVVKVKDIPVWAGTIFAEIVIAVGEVIPAIVAPAGIFAPVTNMPTARPAVDDRFVIALALAALFPVSVVPIDNDVAPSPHVVVALAPVKRTAPTFWPLPLR